MQKLLLALMAILLGVSGWLGWRADRLRSVAVERVSQLEVELAKRGVVVPSVEVAPTEKEEKALAKTPVAPREIIDAGKYLRMIDELRSRAHELDKDLLQARLETEQLQEKIATQTDDLKKLGEQLSSVKEDAVKQQRVSDALETELKFKAQRLVQVETSEKLLQEKLGKADLAAKRVIVVSKEIEDLNRRREASLLTLERRYREVTDLYRGFSLNLQTRDNPGQGLQAGDLSRIQTALQQAEEELRQLRTLNARVAELARGK